MTMEVPITMMEKDMLVTPIILAWFEKPFKMETPSIAGNECSGREMMANPPPY
jgi:hypothetical protein